MTASELARSITFWLPAAVVAVVAVFVWIDAIRSAREGQILKREAEAAAQKRCDDALSDWVEWNKTWSKEASSGVTNPHADQLVVCITQGRVLNTTAGQ